MSGDIKLSPLGVTHTAYAEALTALHEVEAKSDIALLIARRTDDHDRIVKELREESESRRDTLLQKSEELRHEWIRAEQAEASLLAYQQEAVRLCDESKLYDTADAIRNLPITPRAEAIGRVLEQVRLHYGGGQCGCSICSAWRNLNESERTT